MLPVVGPAQKTTSSHLLVIAGAVSRGSDRGTPLQEGPAAPSTRGPWRPGKNRHGRQPCVAGMVEQALVRLV